MKIFYYFYEKIATFFSLHRKMRKGSPMTTFEREFPKIFTSPHFFDDLLDKITQKVIKSETMQIFRGIFQKFDIPCFCGIITMI